MPPLHPETESSSLPQSISQPHALSDVRDMLMGMPDGVHHPYAREDMDIQPVDAHRVEDIDVGHEPERPERRQWPRYHPYGMDPAQRNVGTAPHQARTYFFSQSDRTVVRPEVLYTYPPLTARSGIVCNSQEVNECIDHFLDLIGWGVPPEYIADAGFSVAGVIWLCAALHIRLSWGIVLRAHESRIPFHPLSIMPDGYYEYNYSQLD